MVYCDHQELFVVYCDLKVVIFPLLWLCTYPSNVEVVVLWICAHPSCVEVIKFWLCANPSSVEVVVLWVCGYPSCVEVIVVEFGFVPLSLLCKGD